MSTEKRPKHPTRIHPQAHKHPPKHSLPLDSWRLFLLEILRPTHPPGKTKWQFWANYCLFSAHFPPIFCLCYGTPSAIFKPTCLQNSPILTYFCPSSAYFPPKLVPQYYPILVINSSMEPICCFSAHMFTHPTRPPHTYTHTHTHSHTYPLSSADVSVVGRETETEKN